MMKRGSLSWLFAGGILAIIVSMGCAGPPTEAIQAAEAAIQEAQTAGSDVYAAERFKAAQDALADAKAKVDSKDYKGAKESADRAIALADSSRTDAAVGKETMRLDAERKLEEMKTMWADVSAAIEKSRGPAGKALVKEAADVAAMVNTLPQQMAEGKYAEVLKAVDEATMKANDLKERAMAAGGKTGGKK